MLLSRCCARIIFQRDSRAPLKVNIQFKVNKVKIEFPNVILLVLAYLYR